MSGRSVPTLDPHWIKALRTGLEQLEADSTDRPLTDRELRQAPTKRVRGELSSKPATSPPPQRRTDGQH